MDRRMFRAAAWSASAAAAGAHSAAPFMPPPEYLPSAAPTHDTFLPFNIHTLPSQSALYWTQIH